jgi:hypothetical protein
MRAQLGIEAAIVAVDRPWSDRFEERIPYGGLVER